MSSPTSTRWRRWRWPEGSILRRQTPLHAPIAQDRLDLRGHEESCALAIVVLTQELVVIRERVPHISHQREPGRCLRRGRAEPLTVRGVVDDGAKLVRGDAWRQHAQRGLDFTTLGHFARPICPDQLPPSDGFAAGLLATAIQRLTIEFASSTPSARRSAAINPRITLARNAASSFGNGNLANCSPRSIIQCQATWATSAERMMIPSRSGNTYPSSRLSAGISTSSAASWPSSTPTLKQSSAVSR